MAPKKQLRDNIHSVTEPAIARLCHRAGIKRINKEVYEEIRTQLSKLLILIISKCSLLTDAEKRTTILERDARKAFELCGVDLAVGINDDIKRAHEHKSSPKKEGSTHRFKAGTVAVSDIKYQQKHSDTYIIPKAVFDRLLHEYMLEYGVIDDPRISDDAKMLIQIGIEHSLVVLLESSYMISITCHQVTLYRKHIHLAVKILETKYIQRC